MPATIIAIADAIVAQLNATGFSQPLTAERHYLPRFELPEMTTLRVSVVPRSVVSKAFDRNRHAFDYRIDVAVQKRINPTENLDAFMALVEEIADHFRTRLLAGFPQARCVEVENSPIYAPEHLEQFHQFTSVLTLTYRVWRGEL